MKKTNGRDKGKGTAKKRARKNSVPTRAVKERSAKTKVPSDFAGVRKNIATSVREAANEIADRLVEMAKGGHLASVKYLFETVGLYPPTAEIGSKPEESLAHRLLTKLGLPTDPVIGKEDTSRIWLKAAVKEDLRDGAGIDGSDFGGRGQRDQSLGEEKSEATAGEVRTEGMP